MSTRRPDRFVLLLLVSGSCFDFVVAVPLCHLQLFSRCSEKQIEIPLSRVDHRSSSRRYGPGSEVVGNECSYEPSCDFLLLVIRSDFPD